MMHKINNAVVLVGMILFVVCSVAMAQTFKPGDIVEYPVRGTYPPKWEPGKVVSEVPGGRQVIVLRKPTPYSPPQGDTAAYSHDELRRPQAAAPQPAAAPANAGGMQALKPGDKVMYPVGGTFPQQWEQGTIEYAIGDGKQVVVRRKPTQFSPPQGDTAAFRLDELKPPQAADAPPAAPMVNPQQIPPLPLPAANANMPAIPPFPIAPQPANNVPPPAGQGLLGRDELIAYAKQVMGDNPFGIETAERWRRLEQIWNYTKARGTNFLIDESFTTAMDAQGTRDTRIDDAVAKNFGPAPALADYYGKWSMVASVENHNAPIEVGGENKQLNTDRQVNAGELEIKNDGTYIWKLSRKDPPEQWVQGTWEQVKPNEFNPGEAGPAIWLKKAQQGLDYMVRINRQPGWRNWIDVGEGPGRRARQYGQKQ